MKTEHKSIIPLAARIRTGFILLCCLVLMLSVFPNLAQDYGLIESTKDDSQAVSEESASLSVGTDEDELAYNQELIGDWQETRAHVVGEKLARLVQKLPDYPEEFVQAMSRSSTPESGWSGNRVFLTILLFTLAGLLLERMTTRRLLLRLYSYAEKQEKTLSLKFRYILTRIIIQLTGVSVLTLIIFTAILYTRHENPYFELLFTEFAQALVSLRLWMVFLRNILSPYWHRLRPIPLDDLSSKQLYHWLTAFFFIIEFGDGLFTYLTHAGMAEVLVTGLLIPYTVFLNLIVLSRFWVMRHKINGMFVTGDTNNGSARFTINFFQTFWPYFFTVWLVIIWLFWLHKAFAGKWEEAEYLTASWWITLAFFGADRIFHRLISSVTKIQWLHSPTFEIRSRRFIRIVQNGFRLLMGSVAVYMFSLAWGLTPDALMAGNFANKALEQLINLLVIATITYIIWEFFNALIERKLPQEPEDAAFATLEGEGGGAGATRAETLLPLMRTLLTVLLFTFVLLSVLHSLGIAITPLLAGAGVVGIAIGFGAQKLVQDVLSGIFFLVDDAFRKSEYIEIEELRGTVEKISLRSMQLRHHLGAVQTIPYGEIRTIRNLSRDWITMKLELRLSYDTDIEKVRKIIKKVGQSMLEDPVIGDNFILPLKSQGVMRMEESALIVRMKFTAKPGEQWVIRREAYRRVRDALSAEGIFFAHREVRVRLPDEQLKNIDPESLREALQQGAAAADSAISAAEQTQRPGKPDFSDDM